MSSDFHLSQEQDFFIQKALGGNNILVDACIGSGKTTAIQYLCNRIPEDRRVLYLTYNKLLKIDAKSKIKNKNVTVTNYHGFAFMTLFNNGISAGVPDLIQCYIKAKPTLIPYDIMIIDEYQDIDQELSELLELIKESNPGMQIIAVGDMEQKIYDKTTLRISEFIEQFLGNHIKLEFTKCFRLSAPLAEKLGRIWHKTIVGVNSSCVVEEMEFKQVIDYLADQYPWDILCLGSRTGDMVKTLNALESKYPDKFNKKTVFASISDNDSNGATNPRPDSAIFTTFDSSKGLERKICVIFDYTESYWAVRIGKPQQSYTILRNIFCVAASRGKGKIIFVKTDEALLSERTISTSTISDTVLDKIAISGMFDFKYKESIEACYSMLDIKPIQAPGGDEINIKTGDELIDLSPCIGIYQEAVFFERYNIDNDIQQFLLLSRDRKFLYTEQIKQSPLENKILFLTALETKQNRYLSQVSIPFVEEADKNRIVSRLHTIFDYNEDVQVPCTIDFSDNGRYSFSAMGFADVVKDNIVYELKFVSELTHEHFLQCASYIAALRLEKGILWNTRDNSRYEISIPNKKKFLNAVAKAVLKRPLEDISKDSYHTQNKTKNTIFKNEEIKASVHYTKNIAIIDTETTWSDRVMSIGIVVADEITFEVVTERYYMLLPECQEGGMFSNALPFRGKHKTNKCSRNDAIIDIKMLFNDMNISSVFAYNAKFDYNHLPELSYLIWHDIMRLAAYKQYNKKIPQYAECYNTGRLKRNYGVEPILRLLSDNDSYSETHNALYDAIDELNIIRLLGHPVEKYECSIISDKKPYIYSPKSQGRCTNSYKYKEFFTSAEKIDGYALRKKKKRSMLFVGFTILALFVILSIALTVPK